MNAINTACQYSLFLQRLINNSLLDSQQLEIDAQRAIDANDLHHFADWQGILANLDGDEMARNLRLLRRLVVARIAVRDLSQQADLQEVVQSMTLFADFAVNMAADFAHAYYVKFYGEPIGAASGEPQRLCVIAMGKMGGGELNVSSDIDLIFIYPENGETNGKKNRTNQEFFVKVGQKIIALLNDITADGQVFRVDMRLRPDGDSGALVINETALEQYLITQGREWERYAWTKARVISPFSNNIKDLVRPFVYRRYLDFNAYDAMRHLHGQIRAEVAKKGMEN
ncbi:MAG: bifunctional glutamine synthetase adenylyltransferase/deadenyltransferase, partial [Neisseriaceae bacterium]|nr:bifunctional glutamine synthetase adenylyltransferase/deadenyltransferase [Neisseriaceae bacterium]